MTKLRINKNRIFGFYIPAALFITSFIWKYINIGARDICIDEPFTIFHAQESLKSIFSLPSQNEPHPPLFMAIMHFWIKLFGIGPYSVRAIPIFFNSLTVVFLYFTGKKFWGAWSGIIASGLFVFSTYHFYFGADTRAYSMLSCATAASLYYFFAISREPEKISYRLQLIVANLFLAYSHYFGWFVIGMQLISSLLYLRNKKIIRSIGIVIFSTVIFYIPMFIVLIKQFLISSKGTWVQPPNSSEYLNQIKWFLNSHIGYRAALFLFIAGILVAVISKIEIKKWRDVLVLFIWWGIPYSFMFFISAKIPMFTNRYILFNSIGFYMFIGGALSFLFKKTKILLPVASAVLLFAVCSKMYTGDFAVRKIKDSANYLKTKVDENSMVLIHPQWANLGFMYYYAPEIFKDAGNYYQLLNQNKIYPAWSITDAQRVIENDRPQKVIYYQNNSTSIDASNAIYTYLDSAYHCSNSESFDGGLTVSVFEKRTTPQY